MAQCGHRGVEKGLVPIRPDDPEERRLLYVAIRSAATSSSDLVKVQTRRTIAPEPLTISVARSHRDIGSVAGPAKEVRFDLAGHT